MSILRALSLASSTLILALAMAPSAFAQAPRLIPYQGVLSDGGTPVTSATSVAFSLFDVASGGTALWTETQSVTPDASGVFEVQLGAVADLDALDFGQPLWLDVSVGGTAVGPRTTLGAVPYALAMYGVRVTPPTSTINAPSIAAGHPANEASGDGAVVAGGGFNDGFQFLQNRATGYFSTVGGGIDNMASNLYATVGGGRSNTASNLYATVGGGDGNTASGSYAAVPGGYRGHARGDYSFAAGYYARAIHDGTFVWSDNSQTNSDSLVSTGQDQFLIRAAGGVGLNTNAPLAQLHVETLDIDLPSAALFNEDIIAEASDAVVGLYSDPGGSWGSAVTLGEISSSGALTSKWAMVRETDAAGGSLYFTYKGGPGSENYASNLPKVRFDINGSVHGGTYSSSGADFAEWLPLHNASSTVEPGQLVGVTGGRVGLATEAAEQVMIVSSNPAFVGNPNAAEDGALVALVGQAEVRLASPAEIGDLLVATGQHDGLALAVSPARYDPATDGAVAGRILALVNATTAIALVGVDEAAALRGVVARQQHELATQTRQLADANARLDIQQRQLDALAADRDRQQAQIDALAADRDRQQAQIDALVHHLGRQPDGPSSVATHR